MRLSKSKEGFYPSDKKKEIMKNIKIVMEYRNDVIHGNKIYLCME